MGDLIHLPLRQHDPLLSKTQLASHYGYSRRWVEIQVARGAYSKYSTRSST